MNDAPLSPWRLPDSYKNVKTSGTALEDNTESAIISEVPPEVRLKSPSGTIVKTPHSILHSPLDFLPILFRHARLLEHAMSVLELLNPTLAAHRRKLLCHCGEGFADPESAAIAIAVEDKSAAPRETAVGEAFVPGGAEIAVEPPRPDHSMVMRPVSAPLHVHKRRSNWLRTAGSSL